MTALAVSPQRTASVADLERAERAAELFHLRDHAPDERTRDATVDELVALHLPLARSAANRYQTHHDDHEDVFQVACLGLVKAVLRYDPSVGAPFGAFATPTITGEVRRYFRDHAWDIRPPRWIQEMRPDVQRAVERLTHELGRGPSVTEVADRLDADSSQVREAMGAVANCLNVYSLDMPSDSEGTLSVRDHLGEVDPDLETAPERMALRPLVAALDDRDRKILVLRFVRGYTQRRIADEIGLSQTQVCRLLERILADLRAQLAEEPSSTLG